MVVASSTKSPLVMSIQPPKLVALMACSRGPVGALNPSSGTGELGQNAKNCFKTIKHCFKHKTVFLFLFSGLV